MQQGTLFQFETKEYTARQINILNSPKQSGNCDIDSESYLKKLGIDILNKEQPIQFSPNVNEGVHRWAPYVQGFSAELLSNVVDKIFFGPTADALRGLFGSFHQPSLQSQIQ